MRMLLLSVLLVLAAAACGILLILGTFISLLLFFLGLIGFAAGLSSADLHLTCVALFGLLTVGLCSACCFGGLCYLFNGCLDNLGQRSYGMDGLLILVSLLSVAATAAIFPATSNEWFLPVCIMADVVHIVTVIVWLRHRKRSRSCAEPSPSSPALQ